MNRIRLSNSVKIEKLRDDFFQYTRRILYCLQLKDVIRMGATLRESAKVMYYELFTIDKSSLVAYLRKLIQYSLTGR